MTEDKEGHETEEDSERGIEYTVFYCHDEERACNIILGADFDHCPYCGEEVDDEI